MGLIGARLIKNPLDQIENIVIFGGTHKTFPGPACGLIMTNNDLLHNRLETTINPIYIRHTQMHQKVSLLFTLIEFENFGQAYQEHIVNLSDQLGKELNMLDMNVAKKGDRFSFTHQVFIKTNEQTMNRIFERSIKYGITLNKKHKDLFSGFGIRLGTQEIARYNWPVEAMKDVAKIIKMISEEKIDDEEIRILLNGLPDTTRELKFSQK